MLRWSLKMSRATPRRRPCPRRNYHGIPAGMAEAAGRVNGCGVGTFALVGVAGGDLAGDRGALHQIAVHDHASRRRAATIALLEAAIAAVEARHHLVVTVAGRGFGVDQGLGLDAPVLAFVARADAVQEVQRAEDFGEPLQVAVVRRGLDLRRHRGRRLRRRLPLTGFGQCRNSRLRRLGLELWLVLVLAPRLLLIRLAEAEELRAGRTGGKA